MAKLGLIVDLRLLLEEVDVAVGVGVLGVLDHLVAAVDEEDVGGGVGGGFGVGVAPQAQPEPLRLVRLLVAPPVKGPPRAVMAAPRARVRPVVYAPPAVGLGPRALARFDVLLHQPEKIRPEVAVRLPQGEPTGRPGRLASGSDDLALDRPVDAGAGSLEKGAQSVHVLWAQSVFRLDKVFVPGAKESVLPLARVAQSERGWRAHSSAAG